MLDQVLAEVEEQCREERVPMLGPDKATLLASCVEIVADNVGRADQMADYLEHVRSHYDSETHWFESRRRPGRRDGMEVSIYRR
ncbi:MAG: hypothetical protein OXI61_20425 [Candidatus Poribacteria bacterium]|nr:hypothetical protein [Candidatus Poribacteria bacterium]